MLLAFKCEVCGGIHMIYEFGSIGISQLFGCLISAIIARKDDIERENELKKRDSVFLPSVNTPTWAAQADEEEAREKERIAAKASWSCCQT